MALTGPHSNTFTAPSVTCHDYPLSSNDKVGGVHPSVEDGLPGTVPVVEEVLHLGIVDIHHGELELLVRCHGLEPDDAGGGLLVASLDVGEDLPPGGVGHGDQVGTVVDDEIGLHVEDGVEIRVVFLVALEFLCVDLESELLAECGCDGVVGGKGIAAGEPDLRSRISEGDGEHPGLGLGVEGHSDLKTGQRLLLPESFIDLLDDRHVVVGPVEPETSFLHEFVHFNSP